MTGARGDFALGAGVASFAIAAAGVVVNLERVAVAVAVVSSVLVVARATLAVGAGVRTSAIALAGGSVADADSALAVAVESGITCNGDIASSLANALVVVAVAIGVHEVRGPGTAVVGSLRAGVGVDMLHSARLVAKGLAHLSGGSTGVGRVAETAVVGAATRVGVVHEVGPDLGVAEGLVGSTHDATSGPEGQNQPGTRR